MRFPAQQEAVSFQYFHEVRTMKKSVMRKTVRYAFFFSASALILYLLGNGLLQTLITCAVATFIYAFVMERFIEKREL